MRTTSRSLPVLVVVALVAALVLGSTLLHSVSRDPDRGAAGGPPGTAAEKASADATVALDQGPTTQRDVTSCLAPEFASGADQVDVLYGQVQLTASGTAPVLVLRNRSGDLRLCDGFGGDAPAEAPLPAASGSDPVVFVSNGRSAWSCEDGDKVLKSLRTSVWLAVSPDVTTVQQRFYVNDVPGPWFTTTAHGGYAHLQSWLEGPRPSSSRYAVQYRVLGAAGNAVPQKALPTAKQPLPGCTRGGSAEIG